MLRKMLRMFMVVIVKFVDWVGLVFCQFGYYFFWV